LADPQSRMAQVVDARYLLNVLINLNVGIRKLSLYHASHPIIPEIVSNIVNEFDTIFEDPWSRKWQPTPVFLPGESHGQKSLVGYSPRGHKESDKTETTSHKH